MKKSLSETRLDGKTIKLIGRSSRLSQLQIDIVKKKIRAAFPGVNVKVIERSSRGDTLQNIPLHTVEGSDFFTADIFDALAAGEADIAVHSLKDMSSNHFFGQNQFAVIERDDTRDIAIFNPTIEEKLRQGKPIIIGTCSPRREEMATVFLKKALPQLHKEVKIETKPIRGNVETRLGKLNTGEYDATILATAGLNRLLKSKQDAPFIKELLLHKKLMLLPLVECVPAPCQGAIVAEAHQSNSTAIRILHKINNRDLFDDCYRERKEAIKYGAGCLQKFGVTTIHTRHGNYLYAAGKDAEGTGFVKWNSLPDLKIDGQLFSTTDNMKGFFDYEWNNKEILFNKRVVFIANYKSIQGPAIPDLTTKTVFASGAKTWFELAKNGYWVTASADALGFEFLMSSLPMPLLDFHKKDVVILTHKAAKERWLRKEYDAISNYELLPRNSGTVQRSVAGADAIFWTSFSQYEFYGQYAKPGVKHLCAGGETAELLIQQGLQPVIFPTIKAFEQWRKYSIRSHSGA